MDDDLCRVPAAYLEAALDISTAEIVDGEAIPDASMGSPEGRLHADTPVPDASSFF